MKSVFLFLVLLLLMACEQTPPMSERVKLPPLSKTGKIPGSSAVKQLPKPVQSAYRMEIEDPLLFSGFGAPVYTGKLATPVFAGNPFAADPEYVAFIRENCKKGINFGGHYTAFERGCGAECLQLFIVDRKTGHIFTGIGMEEGHYGYRFETNSTLLIANYYLFQAGSVRYYHDFYCQPEFYRWQKGRFKRLKKTLPESHYFEEPEKPVK
jgi:hypothetical protein